MANLAEHQKLTWVLPSLPFGDGADGTLTISSNTTQSVANSSFSGTSGSATLTLASASTFANGDILLCYQSRGGGVGQWEIAKILSGGGTTTLTLTKNLVNTYTDSGASQAQVYEVKMYSSVTVNTGTTWSAPEWDGNVGGLLLGAVKNNLTIDGIISSNGTGFRGGAGGNESVGRTGFQGEGTAGANTSQSTDNNGSGGGGGGPTDDGGSHSGAGGGGGGNGGSGSTGTAGSFSGTPGTGGSASSSSDLLTFILGGGGGGGGGEAGYTGGTGGDGSGGIILFARNIVSVNSITLNGVAGGNGGASSGGGGGGSAGSCLIVCQTATLGSNKIIATIGSGGTTGSYGGVGGDGGTGVIAIHHSASVTGTTSPTFTDISDTSLREGGLSFIL